MTQTPDAPARPATLFRTVSGRPAPGFGQTLIAMVITYVLPILLGAILMWIMMRTRPTPEPGVHFASSFRSYMTLLWAGLLFSWRFSWFGVIFGGLALHILARRGWAGWLSIALCGAFFGFLAPFHALLIDGGPLSLRMMRFCVVFGIIAALVMRWIALGLASRKARKRAARAAV